MRIVDQDGVRNYVAQPGGRPPTSFRQAAIGEGWIRFENPAHDFPQRVEYRREGNTLLAEISGPGDGGQETVIRFDYVPCGS